MDIELLKIIMSDCSDFVTAMAQKITDKTTKKDAKIKLSRMKQKIDKYFLYITKNEPDIIEI